MSQVLIKYSTESLLFDMDFLLRSEPDETITNVVSVVTTPVNLVSGFATINWKTIQFRLDGGTPGSIYTVNAIVTTSKGNTLEGSGCFRVVSPSCNPVI